MDTAKAKVPRDTIKAPLASAELPSLDDPSQGYRLDLDEIFGSGARTVGDLVARIPGAAEWSTGWMALPATGSYLGDPSRVRVFIDGLEYTSLDPHAGGALDYAQIPLWTIETAVVERSASEVRVYLDTWRVNRTTPFTRTDISTGDFQTNMYRGFFGRRFAHGEALQFGVQQYGTSPVRGSATSDQLSLMGRLGWARGRFSVDGFMMQVGSHRGATEDPISSDSLPRLQATRRDAYLRVGWGQPGDNLWAQAVASTSRDVFAYGSGATTATGVPVPDSTSTPGDTTRSAAQYLLAGGLSRWGVNLTGSARYFPQFARGGSPIALPVVLGDSTAPTPPPCCIRHGLLVPSARANYHWWRLGLSAFAEGRGLDSTSRREVNAELAPFSFLRLSAAVGSARDARVADSVLSPAYHRYSVGLRLHDVWLTGGILSRGGVNLAAPTLVKDSLVNAADGPATAKFVAVQGRVWKGIHADVFGLRWDDSTGLYRPQFQAMSKLYISTSLLDRFPSNSFHFYLALTHEYQSAGYFPMPGGPARATIGYRAVGAQLEIRIERAVLTYRFTNALGEKYNVVPGYLMPRQASVYGVRWEFWN